MIQKHSNSVLTSMERDRKIKPKPGDRVAIIGSGISGLGVAWLLSKKYDVVLFEASNRLGGHARTEIADTPHGKVPVDIGFIVFNKINYPNLCNLFKELGVKIQKSDMSFAVSVNSGQFEYGSRNLKAFLAQPRNIFEPKFWRMYRDISLFFNTARKDVSEQPQMSVEELIQQRKFGQWFVNYYLLPMSGAIWSTPRSEMLKFPAHALVQFFANHGLLSFSGKYQWWTVTGGSQNYVKKIAATMKAEIRLKTPVVAVTREAETVLIKTPGQEAEIFDCVIFASHTDNVLQMLNEDSETERQILGNIAYQQNRVILHTDVSFMPKRKACWSSWVYLANESSIEKQASVTYWMNSLQGLPRETPLFVTLNPSSKPDNKSVLVEHAFDHPRYDAETLKAQKEIDSIQGKDQSWYCGAWMGMGFHEDGLASAVSVAQQFGVKPPWN